MLEYQYQYRFIADGSRIDSSAYEEVFRKFLNVFLDLRLIAPVVTEETTITITLKKFISEENKFEIIKLRFNKELNTHEILYCDKNRPWQPFYISIQSIEYLIDNCFPETIKDLIELITPQIDAHKINLFNEINNWIVAGRPDNINPISPEDIPVVEEVPLSTKTNIFVPGIINDDE